MISGKDRGRYSGVDAEVLIDRDAYEIVEEFMYLATLVINEVSREVKRIEAVIRTLQTQMVFRIKRRIFWWLLQNTADFSETNRLPAMEEDM